MATEGRDAEVHDVSAGAAESADVENTLYEAPLTADVEGEGEQLINQGAHEHIVQISVINSS